MAAPRGRSEVPDSLGGRGGSASDVPEQPQSSMSDRLRIREIALRFNDLSIWTGQRGGRSAAGRRHCYFPADQLAETLLRVVNSAISPIIATAMVK